MYALYIVPGPKFEMEFIALFDSWDEAEKYGEERYLCEIYIEKE